MGEAKRRKKLGINHKTPLKVDLAKVIKIPNLNLKNPRSKGMAFMGVVHTSLRDAVQLAIKHKRVTYIRLGKRTLFGDSLPLNAKEILSLFEGNPIDFVFTEYLTFCVPHSVSTTKAADQIAQMVSDLDLRQHRWRKSRKSNGGNI